MGTIDDVQQVQIAGESGVRIVNRENTVHTIQTIRETGDELAINLNALNMAISAQDRLFGLKDGEDAKIEARATRYLYFIKNGEWPSEG